MIVKIVFAFTKLQVAETIGSLVSKTDEVTFAFNSSEVEKALSQGGRDLSYLFIHEEIYFDKYPWEWLSSIKSRIGEKTRVVVILSENTDSLYREIIKRISIDLGVSLIPNGLTSDELAQEVSYRLYGMDNSNVSENFGRVVTLMSASPKDGATTIAISTAICAALRLPDKKVLLVDNNLKSPEIRDHLHLTSDKGYPLIQADCDAGTLEISALLRACEHLKGIDNLYILTGIQRREWAEKVTMEEMGHLLDIARTTFNLIFVDVHTFPDQAATLKCIKDADERLVIVQPIITSYQSSWNDWFNSVWQYYGLSESDFSIVMNRDTKAVMDGFQIEKSMSSNIVARIRNVEKGGGIKAINYGLPLYLSSEDESKEFRENILELTSWITERAKIDLVPLENDKKSTLRAKRKKVFGFI